MQSSLISSSLSSGLPIDNSDTHAATDNSSEYLIGRKTHKGVVAAASICSWLAYTVVASTLSGHLWFIPDDDDHSLSNHILFSTLTAFAGASLGSFACKIVESVKSTKGLSHPPTDQNEAPPTYQEALKMERFISRGTSPQNYR